MKKLSLLLITICILFSFTGCGSKLYDSGEDGYVEVTNVEGVTFEVSSSWSQAATAIFTIKEDDYYNGLYVKKTDDSYLLFDMSQILIVCSKTNFNFEGNETVDNLQSHDINNVWLTTDDDKLEYDSNTKDGVYKIIANAKADYSVTPTQYATFEGQVATVRSGDVEYSLFAGASTANGSLSKSQLEIVNYVVKTFKMTEGTETTTEIEEVASTEIEGADSSEDNITNEEPIEEVEENTEDTTEEQVEEIPLEEVEEPQKADEDVDEETVVEETEETEADESEEIEVVEESTDVTEDTPAEEQVTSQTPSLTTDAGTNSTTYEPLQIGEAGSFFIVDGDLTISAAVRPVKLYTGTEATDLIKKYGGRKTNPSVGTEFVVLEYSATEDPREYYIDCKFLGVDGENLVYLGVPYPSKCYDMYDGITVTDGIYNNIYLYYEVPIGTREYLLKFGSPLLEQYLTTDTTANFIVDTGYRAQNSRTQLEQNKE